MRSPVGWIVRGVAKALAIAVAVLAFIALFSWVVLLLWNYLVPVLFHGPELGYWQAFALLLLSRILFGGIRGHRGPAWRRHMGRERCESMTAEERERLRQRFFERCGRGTGGAGQAEEHPQA